MSTQQITKFWQEVVSRVAEEWEGLPYPEQVWATEHTLRIVNLQERLHQLFLDVGGAGICSDCNGDCCGHGKFHPTLVNLLACLITEQPFPEPEFDQYCPYLGVSGCQFPPGLRPYNCISFICEQIENRLDPDKVGEFYQLEKEIREQYELFASRYVGASMRGILTRGETLPSYLTKR
jgi:hypothetical protein